MIIINPHSIQIGFIAKCQYYGVVDVCDANIYISSIV